MTEESEPSDQVDPDSDGSATADDRPGVDREAGADADDDAPDAAERDADGTPDTPAEVDPTTEDLPHAEHDESGEQTGGADDGAESGGDPADGDGHDSDPADAVEATDTAEDAGSEDVDGEVFGIDVGQQAADPPETETDTETETGTLEPDGEAPRSRPADAGVTENATPGGHRDDTTATNDSGSRDVDGDGGDGSGTEGGLDPHPERDEGPAPDVDEEPPFDFSEEPPFESPPDEERQPSDEEESGAFHDMPGPTDTMAAPESDLETGYGTEDAEPTAAADAPAPEAGTGGAGPTPEAAGDGGETPGVHQEVNRVQEVPTPTPPGAEEPEPVPEYTEPPDDEELPLTEHIEEMVKRLGVVLIAAAVVTVLAFPLAEDLITVVWYHVHPGSVANCPGAEQCTPPHLYGPLELKLAELKLASLAGIVAALPVFVYESYLFMRPGLYPQERRYYLAAVPTSLVLALVGVAFSYFLVLPALFTYFLYYSQESVDQIAFALRQTFDLIMMMLGFMAVVFQIPLFIMLAIMMGVTTRAWLASRRLYFWGAFVGIAFLFSPDPTGMAPIIVAATMVTLFEGTLLLLKWTQQARR